MKKQLFFFLVMLVAITVRAQDEKYTTAMKNAITVVDTCEAKNTFIEVREKFDFISKQKKDEWLPVYYMAFCDVHIAMLEKDADSIDYYAGRADEELKAAETTSKDNSEIYCLKALNTIAQINVDYMGRALAYSSRAGKFLDDAEKIDPKNPRIYYLQGRFLYGRPKQFGGGKEAAKPFFQKAVDVYNTKDETASIFPHWGKRLSFYLLDACSKTN
jgi:hypothetical protein